MANKEPGFFQQILDKIDIQVAIRTGTAAGVGLIVAGWYSRVIDRPDSIVSGLWCVLTAVIVLQAHLGGTYTAAINRFFSVLVGSLMGGAMTTFIGSSPLSLSLGVFLTVIVCAILNLKESYRIASVSAVVVMVLWGLHPSTNPWVFSLYRFLDSFVGILIAVVVAHTVWPLHAVKKMRTQMAESMRELNLLFRMSILTEPNQPYQKSVYKEKIWDLEALMRDNRKILEESKPEMLTESASFEEWTLLLNDFDRVLENILALGHVFKENTRKIFDVELDKKLKKEIDEIDGVFEQIACLIESKTGGESIPDLNNIQEELKEELTRFRSTRATREFHLEDVENFFVLFYSIKTLVSVFKKIITRVAIINQ